MKIYKRLCTIAFLVLAAILFYTILTSSGDMLINSCYSSIVLCFVYALLMAGNPILLAALACTVGADYYLITFVPSRQLPGMAFFLVAQGLYALFLHRQGFKKAYLSIFFKGIAKHKKKIIFRHIQVENLVVFKAFRLKARRVFY